jgi:NADH-quinone oxidoreductase subunit H
VTPFLEELAIAAVKVGAIIGLLLGLFSFMTWAERRLLALMQFRLGPNRTGPLGLLQPVADGIKLFFKEETIPEGAHRGLFLAAPVIAVVTAFTAIAVVPYGPTLELFGRQVPLQIASLDVGLLFIFAVTSLGVYSVVLAGYASNNKFGLLGGLRSSAQMFSYELTLGMSWVGVIMLAQSFQIADIVGAQAGGFWRWNLALQPLAAFTYFAAATAEVSRTPFDLTEAEQELVAGFHTEYSSMRFALLQMAEYVNIITVAVLAVNLFLGGWHFPFPGVPASPLWFALKVAAVLFVFIWLRGTLPRLRYDQLMAFGWKVLLPLVTLNILVTAALVQAGVL